MKNILPVCVALALAGCANAPDIGGAVSQLTDGLKGGLTSVGAVPAPGHFKESGLYHVMQDNGNGWPRAAITINSLPANAYINSIATNMGSRYSYGSNYCMNVSVVLWHDAKHSQSYNGAKFCGNDIPNNTVSADTGQFLLWAGSLAQGANTGARRTNGPNPPKNNFPQGSGYVSSFAGTNGMNLFAQFMFAMGYDIADNGDDHRAWVVSMPSASQMAN
ncbi:hypothetical protein G3O00_08555 [Burkholderia sp. Ac-20384]|uniref:hypothetical protein n=1 Tax=Burkholderia sp. Ac-20384 TaxID=2703902 RepID=UPI001981E28F|nr:hypothetical protein [Burkholderia sp. Ac-20384]MBN3823669.1 hypothetical protein [Burkholderia sp. Ac-20384]